MALQPWYSWTPSIKRGHNILSFWYKIIFLLLLLFKTNSNIYDGVFLQEYLTVFTKILHYRLLTVFWICLTLLPTAYLEPTQTCMMEPFSKKVNDQNLQYLCRKCSAIDLKCLLAILSKRHLKDIQKTSQLYKTFCFFIVMYISFSGTKKCVTEWNKKMYLRSL